MTEAGHKLRILLADDHELVRRGIRGLLKSKRKWKVIAEARDGIEAVEKTEKLKPDIVILDIDMPNLDGLQAARRIRESTSRTKIVILTLHESGEMVRRALEAGAQGLVLKSEVGERLVTALEEISRRKIFLTPKASDIVMRDFLANEVDSQPKPTSREVQVIRLLAEGKANKEVAVALGISVRTVEVHRANLMKKLDLHSLAEIVHYALRYGLAAQPAQTGSPPHGPHSHTALH